MYNIHFDFYSPSYLWFFHTDIVNLFFSLNIKFILYYTNIITFIFFLVINFIFYFHIICMVISHSVSKAELSLRTDCHINISKLMPLPRPSPPPRPPPYPHPFKWVPTFISSLVTPNWTTADVVSLQILPFWLSYTSIPVPLPRLSHPLTSPNPHTLISTQTLQITL